MNLRPLHDQVVIQRLSADTISAGGIVIPDNAAEKPVQGIVIAAGPGRKVKNERLALDVKPGDKVIFGWNSGHEIKVEGQDYIVMKEEEIFAVVE